MEGEIDAGLKSIATSNVFGDKSAESDVGFRLALDGRLDFGRYWSAGYSGWFATFTRHPELLAHYHEAFLFMNPRWGEDAENEAVVEARVETLRNDDTYQSLYLVRPVLFASLALEPKTWFRIAGSVEGAYRLFYDERTSDSFDAMTEARLTFMLPSRTTIVPFGRYGVRRFVRAPSSVTDMFDQQADVGATIGQGLWHKAGLRLEYFQRFAPGSSGLLVRKVTEPQFQLLGDDFIWRGFRGEAVLRQVLGAAWSLKAGANVEQREYPGWPAINPDGTLATENRQDLRLSGTASVSVAWDSREASALPSGKVTVEYISTRQWSTSDWYDTWIHSGTVTLVLSW